MPSRIETDLTTIDTELTRVTNTGRMNLMGTRQEMFRDETFWIRDPTTGSSYAFCNRGTFYDWCWGSGPTKVRLTFLQHMLNIAFTEAASRWGARFPFSFIYHDQCPSFRELSNGGLDLDIADDLVLAINNLKPGTAVRLAPAQRFSFDIGRGRSYNPNGLVYAHSDPIINDTR